MIEKYRIERSMFDGHDFLTVERLIHDQGYLKLTCDNIVTKIYNSRLAFILSKEEVPVMELRSRLDKSIKTYEFTQSYVKGFVKGVEYFKEAFGVNVNVLYGEHSAEFIRNLHMNQYHVRHSDSFYEGWNLVKDMYPWIISHSILEEFGYYAGIVSQVDEMKHTHPKLFLKYDRCDEPTPGNREFSIAEFASALHFKDIRISRNGVGIDDGINYVEKFGLRPGHALYNRLNDITKDRRDPSKLKSAAEAIIKEYKL